MTWESTFHILVLEDGSIREAFNFPEEYCFAYEFSTNPYPRPVREAREKGLIIDREGFFWNVQGEWFDNLESIRAFYRNAMRNPVIEILQ